MTLKQLVILLVILSHSISQILAQAVDNFTSSRNINNESYFRLHYENDYFTATDLYYTQGILFEFVHPALNKFPLTHLLIQPSHYLIKTGIGLELDGYTPSSIRHNEILYNDHPYAGTMFLKTFVIATDSSRSSRISTALVTGVIGPLAAGDEIQTSIHRWLGNFEPLGWQNQIANDVLLNYELIYEKEIVSIDRFLLINGVGTARAGTLSDKISAGLILMTGYFNSPFLISATQKNKINAHIYFHPAVSFVGYDATLQGGIFNNNSPYTIDAGEIERITFQYNAGIVVYFKKIYLEYFQSYTSKEFKQGKLHRSGGIRIGLSF